MMADSNSNALKKELVTSETFMTDEEVKEKNQQKLRELEILKSELNSIKKSKNRLFVSSYPENPTGSVLFLSNKPAKLRSQVEKDLQSMRKKTT